MRACCGRILALPARRLGGIQALRRTEGRGIEEERKFVRPGHVCFGIGLSLGENERA